MEVSTPSTTTNNTNCLPKNYHLYKECLKNHAASLGGYAVDGCCEYMPSPTSLKCFACGCHRNFHRREENSQISNPHCQAPHRENSASPTPISSSSHHPSVPQMLLALSTGVSDKSGARKRYRTKFSKEQKEKMYSFAEKLGWKIPRTGEGTLMMGEYCNDIGVEKGVFKVWMHNHKVTRGKRDYVISGTSTITTSSGNSNLHNRNVEN